jgi:hypothetical protein
VGALEKLAGSECFAYDAGTASYGMVVYESITGFPDYLLLGLLKPAFECVVVADYVVISVYDDDAFFNAVQYRMQELFTKRR